jgi:CheY-like chemotaxis protein
MKVLVIEDNPNKLKQIKNFLKEYYNQPQIEEARSFNGGKAKLYEETWDLILLDMSLPTYDITHTEYGGDKKPVAGKNLMKRMLNRKIFTPVVIITQFETFDDDRISLDSLNQEFNEKFSNIWKGTIFYGNDDWNIELKKLLDELDL